MVVLEQLRYVRLVADDLGRAADFAQRVLGLEPIDRTEELATFRSDFRDYTLAFATGERAVQSVGLEVRYSQRSRRGARRLAAGSDFPPAAARRRTARCARSRTWSGSTDFSGNRIELVVRPLNSGWRYFPSRDAGIAGLADVIMRSHRHREGLVDLVRRSRRSRQRLGRRRGLSAFRRCPSPDRPVPGHATRHSRRRIRGRGRQSADAELTTFCGTCRSPCCTGRDAGPPPSSCS